jgi:hypothetical protein
MLKIFGRILIILFISGLIAGGIYLIVQHDPTALGTGDRQAGFEGRLGNHSEQSESESQLLPKSDTWSTRPAHFRDGEQGHDFDGEISVGRGLAGITRNLIVFSLITLLVAGLQQLFSRINRKRPVRAG